MILFFFFLKKWIIYKLCDMYCNKIIYIFFNEGFVENKLNDFFVCFVDWFKKFLKEKKIYFKIDNRKLIMIKFEFFICFRL